jgi:hypothetical protein
VRALKRVFVLFLQSLITGERSDAGERDEIFYDLTSKILSLVPEFLNSKYITHEIPNQWWEELATEPLQNRNILLSNATLEQDTVVLTNKI